jgi:hypothetical protein
MKQIKIKGSSRNVVYLIHSLVIYCNNCTLGEFIDKLEENPKLWESAINKIFE